MKDEYAKNKIEEINKFRTKCKMKPIILVTKNCMCCGHKFESEGPHNRLCHYCRDRKEDLF